VIGLLFLDIFSLENNGIGQIILIKYKNIKRHLYYTVENRTNLTKEEHAEVMEAEAVWHNGPEGKANAAVWKSINPKTKKVTYVTNTHRAYNTAPTLKGAIGKFHSFIKGTA